MDLPQATLAELRLPEDGGALVVLAELAAFAPVASTFEATLTENERVRADRFVTPALRAAYVTAHGVLRAVLGRCLGLEPGGLRFGEGAHGKPFLVGEGEGTAFNLSHARRFMAVAVAARGDLGVDVEEVAREVSPGLVEACTSPKERALFTPELDGEARRRLFFRIWTRKEAVLKAAGVGIGVRLSAVDVAPEVPTAVVTFGAAGERYRVTSWDGLPAGLAGAHAERADEARGATLRWLVPGARG